MHLKLFYFVIIIEIKLFQSQQWQIDLLKMSYLAWNGIKQCEFLLYLPSRGEPCNQDKIKLLQAPVLKPQAKSENWQYFSRNDETIHVHTWQISLFISGMSFYYTISCFLLFCLLLGIHPFLCFSIKNWVFFSYIGELTLHWSFAKFNPSPSIV